MKNRTTTMSVSLPTELKEYVKKRTVQEHYGTPSDYIRGLIREDLKRHEEAKLERMLMDGLSSGKGQIMTDKAWEKLRVEVHKKFKKPS